MKCKKCKKCGNALTVVKSKIIKGKDRKYDFYRCKAECRNCGFKSESEIYPNLLSDIFKI